jgi:hypothetical protein
MNVTGETNLQSLLAAMQPALHESPYVFCTVGREVHDALPFDPLGTFREPEGITVIVTEQQASNSGLPFDATWACITLTVHSALSAVGFLAAITGRLARAGISVNPVSAHFHDHLFVPWQNREQAMAELRELSARALP